MTHNPKYALWYRTVAAITLTWAGGTFSVLAADGNPPDLMTYQSYLTDANGVALGSTAPKNYDVIFRIYNDQSATAGANRLWTEQQTVTIDKGYFSVLLGEGSDVGSEVRPVLSSLFTGLDISDRFIEMTVKGIGAGGTDTTIKPRLRLMTSPYAFVAKHAVNAANLVNSANNAVINAVGSYVGINKLNPTTALDVVGTVNATTFVGNGTIPVGGIIMWSGSVASIPTGWALCNGQTASGKVTPNLQDRFIVGAGSTYAVNASGGSASVILSANQLPAHNHQYKDGYHVEQDGYGTGLNGADWITAGKGTQGSDNGNNLIWYRWLYSEINVTAGQAISTLPPYYALAYIMRVQ
jgi:microcystin-dependent protein